MFGWFLLCYAVGLLAAVALGLLIHPEWKSWNLYPHRSSCASAFPLFSAYVLLAFVHFFGMGFALVGLVFYAIRCADNEWEEYAWQWGLQIGLGGLVYVCHLAVTYCGIRLYSGHKPKAHTKPAAVSALPLLP